MKNIKNIHYIVLLILILVLIYVLVKCRSKNIEKFTGKSLTEISNELKTGSH